MNNEKLAGMKIDEPVIGHVIDCRKLNVRKDPDENAEILSTIPVGSAVMIDESESTGDFYKIYAESGVEGFCKKKFITAKS